MTEATEKPDRDVEELIEGVKRGLKQAKEGKGSSVEEVKARIEGKK